jgi:hypothetical protein
MAPMTAEALGRAAGRLLAFRTETRTPRQVVIEASMTTLLA